MSRPPKRKRPGLGATGAFSNVDSPSNHAGTAAIVNVLRFWPLMPFAAPALVVLARWIGGAG